MNRIILIGNGFDLAHGLKTSYRDFLNDYWDRWIERLGTSQYDPKLDDGLYRFSSEGAPLNPINNTQYPLSWESCKSYDSIVKFIETVNTNYSSYGHKINIKHEYTSRLFEAINKAYLERWVDIEREYYGRLKKIYRRQTEPNITQTQLVALKDELKKLHEDLEFIKRELVKYLTKIQKEKIKPNLFIDGVRDIIFEPINVDDISISDGNSFLNHIADTDWKVLHPQKTMLLNFNYTNTAETLYAKSDNEEECELINIHGKLNDPNNPIIFGYGDEMDEYHKKIVDLDDNEYLQHIKSIKYLETSNYRKLLGFINYKPYQIYIMGHSCGNSDRMLLNTLFEHKNCFSIKPFYHKREDGTDDYNDIVQNIYRNFTNPALMRDRVVDKTRPCQPLPQNPKL